MDDINTADAALTEESWMTLSTLEGVAMAGIIAFIVWYYSKSNNEDDNLPLPSNIHINSSPMMNASSSLEEGGFISKMKKSNTKVIVFYGSQTGTAEEFAGRLAKEATKYGLKGMVADPEEYAMQDLERLPEEIEDHLAIFCMATYGEGDPTDNVTEFYQMLGDENMNLENLKYCVFALGNKTYEHFNATGRYVDKKLCEFGATRIFPLGEGDDDGNMEDDFITWKDDLWPKVCDMFGVDSSAQDINMRQYNLTEPESPDYNKVFTGEVNRLKSYTPEKQRPPYDAKNPYISRLLVNKELHSGGDRNCLHLELDITESKIRYDAGDHVAIYPTNRPDLVEYLCQRLGKNPDTIFVLTNKDEYSTKRTPFPCPTSYRTALSHYVDITAPPRTHVLKELVPYTESEEEKERLLLITSNKEEGKAAYHDWIVKSARSITHVLQDLPSCQPPLDYLCELLPRLQARYYSISSSPKAHPTSIHVTAVVLEYQTLTNRTNYGVCTNWLLQQKISEDKEYKLPIFVRKSQFRLPVKSDVPIIMIGPGTGIAPFRGFLQERAAVKAKGLEIGKTVLYFGCRHQSVDFIYEEELRKYEADGVVELKVAFSRDQEEKVYVQHLLAKDGEMVWDVLSKNGHLYVCGDAKNMAREVNSTIVDICKKYGEKTPQQAEQFVKNLILKKKYSSDVWS